MLMLYILFLLSIKNLTLRLSPLSLARQMGQREATIMSRDVDNMTIYISLDLRDDSGFQMTSSVI